MINVNEEIVMYAFRYALGRKTYAAHTMADVLVSNARNLKAHTRQQIVDEIAEARGGKGLGGRCEAEAWHSVEIAYAKLGARIGPADPKTDTPGMVDF